MAKERGLGKGLDYIFGSPTSQRADGRTHYKTVAESIAEKKAGKKPEIKTDSIAAENEGLNENTASGNAVNTANHQNNEMLHQDIPNVEDIISKESVDSAKENEEKTEGGEIMMNIARIQPNKDQPRKDFDEEKLKELAESIAEYGVISPIVVKKNGPLYDIVAGERRWRAARLVGLKEIPVVIKDVDDKTSREISIIENIQRDDLNAVEEALAYQSLIDEYGMTQEEVAKRVSKNRSTITNSLRLLKLDAEILDLLRNGKITQGHARALLAIEDTTLRKKIAEKCANENLSVREIETLVKLDKLSKEKKEKKNSPEAEEMKRLKTIYKDLERQMKSKLGTKVSIVPKSKDKGTLQIEYYTQDDLDRIFMILNSSSGQ